MEETAQSISADVAAIGRIGSVPALLKVICSTTGMGFAAVARVSDKTWTACAVRDEIAFGLAPGGQLELHSTLCFESRNARAPVVIDHASEDPQYCTHHTPRQYNIESYISVPIILPNGEYFGNLCAIDPHPAALTTSNTTEMFIAFAELIALHLENDQRREHAESALLDEKAAADLREQFIAILGHDLRNPLAAMGATTMVIERSSQEVKIRELAQRMGASVGRMSHLIDDVMDLARGRLSTGFPIVAIPVAHLGQALQDVVNELSVAHPDKEILSDIAITAPFRCDRHRIQQLLSNLLGNALTHSTSTEPVRVAIAIEHAALIISVSNQGEPIAPADLPRVFQPYWRPTTSKPGGGLGLGLYICSQIIRAHGGTLEVTSSALAGTTFRASIPVT